MPQYVIEREMPGVGSLGASDLKGASQTSCSVLRELGPEIRWVHSYVMRNGAVFQPMRSNRYGPSSIRRRRSRPA